MPLTQFYPKIRATYCEKALKFPNLLLKAFQVWFTFLWNDKVTYSQNMLLLTITSVNKT